MPRWSDLTPEPNSKQAKSLRAQTLAAARQAPVPDRNLYLRERAAGKRVLDVGVVAHSTATLAEPTWLHRDIAQSAAYCLGVDILADGIKHLAAQGFNVQCADITTTDLGQTFDLVIVGEVIEHLNNPAALFQAAHRLLTPAGSMLITTPNPYYWKRIRNNFLRSHKHRMESADHVTLLFPSGIAELAERHNLQLTCYRGAPMNPRRSIFAPLKSLLSATLLQPEIFSESLIYEIQLPRESPAMQK